MLVPEPMRPRWGLSPTWGEGRDLSPNEMFAVLRSVNLNELGAKCRIFQHNIGVPVNDS